jgi:predicted kinase
MFNACHRFGIYRADKAIDPSGPYAICPECGHRHPFRQLPLLVVSGASGAGKSTVAQLLMGQLDQVVLLDSDILWRPEFDTPQDSYRAFFETWLRMAKNIAQAGRPVVIFGAGMGVPANLEPCVERRYFSRVDYLALVCEDDALAERLHARPAWRESNDQAYVETHLRFNRWFKDRAGELISLLDTTGSTPEDTAGQVTSWITARV